MSNQLITKTYNDLTFTFRADGYFNMTKAAQCFGKQLQHFWNSPDTLVYMDAVSKTSKSDELVETKRGNGGDTWAHPKLAIFFARWLDVRFAVWCDAMIEDILKGNAEDRAKLNLGQQVAGQPTFAANFRAGITNNATGLYPPLPLALPRTKHRGPHDSSFVPVSGSGHNAQAINPAPTLRTEMSSTLPPTWYSNAPSQWILMRAPLLSMSVSSE